MTATAYAPDITGRVLHHMADVEALPTGTTIRNTHGTVFERTGSGLLVTEAGDSAHVPGHKQPIRGLALRGMQMTVMSTPSPATPLDYSVEAPVTYETLFQYQQRFKTGIRGRSIRAGIDERRITGAFMELGIREDAHSLGMLVNTYDAYTLSRLPEHTTVVFGNPDDPNRFRVKGKAAHVNSRSYGEDIWVGLFGRSGGTDLFGEVVYGDGLTRQPWVDETGDASTAEVIRQFKVRAWQVGNAMRQESQWCGEYQGVMRSVEVDDSVTTPLEPVRLFTPVEVSCMTEGAVLRSPGRHRQLFMRDNLSTNEARTIGVSGPGQWAAQMECVHSGEGPMRLRVLSHVEIDHMPVGTTMQQPESGTHTWTKEEDNRWLFPRYGYRYASTDFNLSVDTFYTSIPRRNP